MSMSCALGRYACVGLSFCAQPYHKVRMERTECAVCYANVRVRLCVCHRNRL